MTKFRNNIARRYGIKAAIVAEYLWEGVSLSRELEEMWIFNHIWTRCSRKVMSVELPFLTTDEIGNAIHILLDNGVIRKGSYNEDKFDRTNWYSFTEFGHELMGDDYNEN